MSSLHSLPPSIDITVFAFYSDSLDYFQIFYADYFLCKCPNNKKRTFFATRIKTFQNIYNFMITYIKEINILGKQLNFITKLIEDD